MSMTEMLKDLNDKAVEEQRRRERLRRIQTYYGPRLTDKYYDECQFLIVAKEMLSMFEECLIIREAHGTKNGIADLLLCFRGFFVALELKAMYGTASKQQEVFLEKVAAAKGVGGICTTLQDIWDLLNKAI